MITTPFGPIKIYADDVVLDYEAMTRAYHQGPAKDHPIAGCFRIRVPGGVRRSIRCEVDFDGAPVRNTGSSGQCYADAEFISGTTILTIGAEDENPTFETVRTEHGMEYRIRGSVDEVVFGIAWATDYEGINDVRTWYAADPTLD